MDYQEWTIGNRLSGIEITTELVFVFCVIKAIYLAAHELKYKEKMISEWGVGLARMLPSSVAFTPVKR